MRKTRPQTLAEILGSSPNATAKIISHTRLLNRLNKLLDAVIEPRTREHCTVQNYKNNQLVIQVDSSAWASRLHYDQDKILDFLRQQEECRTLQSIAIKVRPLTVAPVVKSRRMQKPTPETISNLDQTADRIRDPALKTAILKLARHMKKT